ncbi:hypothetical protein F5144DRAFT_588866 [Chaetomium tenue]|uniref:Uncharacterized protein n=1 Tax=Chaetomium tenue TaxID=1854479 RepID=A0ACB7PMR1_9PEZI|nr:hypothetical protein F5144DRAFT_588866 [Chaetomium globosum]
MLILRAFEDELEASVIVTPTNTDNEGLPKLVAESAPKSAPYLSHATAGGRRARCAVSSSGPRLLPEPTRRVARKEGEGTSAVDGVVGRSWSVGIGYQRPWEPSRYYLEIPDGFSQPNSNKATFVQQARMNQRSKTQLGAPHICMRVYTIVGGRSDLSLGPWDNAGSTALNAATQYGWGCRMRLVARKRLKPSCGSKCQISYSHTPTKQQQPLCIMHGSVERLGSRHAISIPRPSLESLAFPPALGSAATLVNTRLPRQVVRTGCRRQRKAALDRSYPFHSILPSGTRSSATPLFYFQPRRPAKPPLLKAPDKSNSNLSSATSATVSTLPYTPVLPALLPIPTDATANLSGFTFRDTRSSYPNLVTRPPTRCVSGRLGMSSPKPYLSFDTEDIKALKHDWLTDSAIAFWEEWLEREVLPKYPQARIILLRPVVSHLLMQTTDLKNDASALPDFRKVTHIFLPISDSRDRWNADSGSHWSLLLVSVIDRVAFHYDSLGGSNYSAAKRGVDRLSIVLGLPLRFHQLEDTPQQENSKDCGVFVCILMRHLLIKRLLNANAHEKVSMSMAGKMVDSRGGRKEMLRIVESLRKEGERRRSASPFASSSNEPPRID